MLMVIPFQPFCFQEKHNNNNDHHEVDVLNCTDRHDVHTVCVSGSSQSTSGSLTVCSGLCLREQHHESTDSEPEHINDCWN